MAKFYKDENGNLYSVDRETGEKTRVNTSETPAAVIEGDGSGHALPPADDTEKQGEFTE